MRPSLYLFVALSAVLSSTFACRTSNSSSAVRDFEYPNSDPGYYYRGDMPQFDQIEMFVSIKGRTLRVEGRPIGDDGQPLSEDDISALQSSTVDYLYPSSTPGRYYVVYPISVAKPGAGNEAAADYNFVKPIARRGPSDHTWHGLPYFGYASGASGPGSWAFHTPITRVGSTTAVASVGQMLHLYRGPVSNGCKRMAPEHILELAHIFGVDTRIPRQVNQIYPSLRDRMNARGRVAKFIHSRADYDHVDGKIVDVNYLIYPTSELIPGDTKLHRTWDLSEDGKQEWVCAFKGTNYDNCMPLNAAPAFEGLADNPDVAVIDE